MGFNCGIIGLPNVGKSTLFNALTQTASAEAMNYPFCTIEPNIGRVGVPDLRLFKLAEIAKSENIIPTQIEIVDIAGLVKGASKGEGLGNQFLGHIRSTEAILHIVRCFEDNDITHILDNVDPLRDVAIVETELMLADLESLNKRLSNVTKKNNPTLANEKQFLQKAIDWLENGRLLNKMIFEDGDTEIAATMNLLTQKPILYVCNVGESDVVSGNKFTKVVEDFAKNNNTASVTVSAAIESAIAVIKNEDEKNEYIASIGLNESGLARVIRSGYDLLKLLTFFTVGPVEARAWTTFCGAKAPNAAGVIHTDFERGFICGETIHYDDYIDYNGEVKAKNAGKMRLEGKDYIVQDGDIMHFRFNI